MAEIQKYIISGIVALIYTLLILIGGWKLNTYYTGYQLNKQHEVEVIVKEGMNKIQEKNASQLTELQNQLNNLKPGVIERQNTIIKQPIYSNTCIDQSGADSLSDYKKLSNEKRGIK